MRARTVAGLGPWLPGLVQTRLGRGSVVGFAGGGAAFDLRQRRERVTGEDWDQALGWIQRVVSQGGGGVRVMWPEKLRVS